MSVCFIKHKNKICASNQKTTISKLLTMPRKLSIGRRKGNKNSKITFTDTSIPSSPQSCIYSKIKAVPEENLMINYLHILIFLH